MNQKKFNPAVRIMLSIIINFTVMFTILGICLAAGIVDRLRTDYSLLATMNMVVGIVLGGTTLLVYRFLDKGNPFKLGFGIRRKDIGFATVVLVVSAIIAWGFIWTMSQSVSLGVVFHYEKLANLSFLLLLGYGCVGWVIGVLQEEVLNRGYFFANMNKMNVIAMFLISNLLFALTHIPTRGFHPTELIVHFVGGLTYGYVYYKSGSLWMSTILHGFHNFLLDILFNNNYSVTLVSIGRQLMNGEKLIQQILLTVAIVLITHLFYGKSGVWTPAQNLRKLWESHGKLEINEVATKQKNWYREKDFS